MNKREYDFDVESFKKDGLDAEDIEIIQDIIDKSVIYFDALLIIFSSFVVTFIV